MSLHSKLVLEKNKVYPNSVNDQVVFGRSRSYFCKQAGTDKLENFTFYGTILFRVSVCFQTTVFVPLKCLHLLPDLMIC